MTTKPTYEDLKQRVRELEKAVANQGKPEEDYRSMIEYTNDIITTTTFSLKPTYTYISPSVKKIMGYEPEELIGKSVFKIIHPGDKKELLPLLKKYLEAKVKMALRKKDFNLTETIEYRAKDKSGNWHYLQSTGNIIGNKLLFISRDITENKEVKERLETSEEVFRTLTENTPIGIYYNDFSGKFIYGNKKAEEIVGYKSEELIGKNFLKLKLLQFKDIGKAAQILALNKLGKATGPEEFTLNRKDGSRVVVEINTEIITIGGKTVVLGMAQDITKRKEATEALRESEERYRKLISEMLNGFALHEIILDETGRPSDYRFLEVNSAFEDLTGLNAADIVGKTALEVIPELEPFWIDTYGKVALTGKPVWFEHFAKPLERYYEVLAYSPQKGQFVTVFTDITTRMQAEEALKESRDAYRATFETTGTAMLIAEEDTTISMINKEFEKLCGYSKEEVEGKKDWIEFLVKADLERMKGYHNLRMTDPNAAPPHYEFQFIDKHGNIKDCLIALSLIPGTKKTVGSLIDITERKQAEEALKESEEKYRTILESIEEGYYEVDIAGNITFVNDSLCTILGYPRDEIIGINNQKYTDEENARRVYQDFNKVYKTGKPTKIIDWEIVRKDTTRRHVEVSVSLIKDSEGNPTGFRGIVRDITERKKAEEEKITLEAQLIQAQKMEAIGTLAGGIAHNFNNLLMSIQGNASLMLLDTPPEHPHYERLTTIEQSVRSGSKLTSQLLGYARGGSYEVTPISINRIIHETSSTFAMTRKDITLHHDLTDALAGVKADAGQIEQVVLNIYVNAAEAMPTGGALYITTKNIAHTQITKKPYTIKPGTYILLTIKDTGIGMDKETQEKVFDPFFTTKGLAKGTGLGLASVYGIIKAHGGYIDVASQKGEGTTFSIYLPASEEIIREEPRPTKSIETGNETILLVDDEEIILDVGEALLTSLGYSVLTAQGGDEAITILRSSLPSSPPDLVILDMIMPGMGGGETYDRMKEIHPTIKVLLSSGYSIDGQAKEILKRGCNGFLQKPFTLGEVSKAIREVVDS
jgi:PAS domain S-box-containing protein